LALGKDFFEFLGVGSESGNGDSGSPEVFVSIRIQRIRFNGPVSAKIVLPADDELGLQFDELSIIIGVFDSKL
jgi:hypothetical protein